MNALRRIESTLTAALDRAAGGPPRLHAAMQHAVFPGGARIRPRLCVAVAEACGGDAPALADAAAAALELLHCASLVHDDLPCFDDAAERRGRASVHHAFGERLAVLAGDALIVHAFETLAHGATDAAMCRRLAAVTTIIARAVGSPAGIAAGQAWECEPAVDLEPYHQAKTGALFVAAAAAGAASCGADATPWRIFGARLGEAYQVADDIRDVVATPGELGKPAGQDAALGRPNVVLAEGLGAAVARLERLAREAVAAIPVCRGAGDLRALVLSEQRRLLPKQLDRSAA